MTLQNIRQLESQIRMPKVMGKVLFNSNMSSLTWFKAGGEAKVFYSPLDVIDLQYFLTNGSLAISCIFPPATSFQRPLGASTCANIMKKLLL